MMDRKMVIETLGWLNTQIDEINGKSKILLELINEEENPLIVSKLEKKVTALERELECIGNKIRLEQEMLSKSK